MLLHEREHAGQLDLVRLEQHGGDEPALQLLDMPVEQSGTEVRPEYQLQLPHIQRLRDQLQL